MHITFEEKTSFALSIAAHNLAYMFAGAILKNHREERLSGFTMGKIHHPERRLPAQNQLNTFHFIFIPLFSVYE